MKRLGTWLTCVMLLALLLPPAFAADTETAVEDGAFEGFLTGTPAWAAASGTCQDGKGCSSSTQCNGGQCFRHKCLC